MAGVRVSSPDKELVSRPGAAGVTKLDLARYYEAVAEVMLPHVAGRPLTMQRFPDGLDAGGFYEKRLPAHFPEWFGRVRVQTADGAQLQPVAESASDLAYLANQACITPHAWLSCTSDLEHPDRLVFDLDPSDDGMTGVRHAARMTGALLDELGLAAWLKTSGSRGYHVLVPLRPRADFDEVRRFAQDAAALLAERDPERLTVEQRKDRRGDRVFLDVLRNGYRQTVVPPYAVRAAPGAPVSTPIEWEELSQVSPGGYDVDSVRRRLAQRTDPWARLDRRGQRLEQARERLDRLT